MYCLASLVLVTDHAYLAVLGVHDVARFPFYVSQVTGSGRSLRLQSPVVLRERMRSAGASEFTSAAK